MAHEVENMMFVGQTPWHGLGKAMISPPATVEEALVQGGLDWRVNSFPMYSNIPLGTTDLQGRAQFLKVPLPGQALIRDSDNSVLGTVGDGYKAVQNGEAFSFFNEALAAGLCDIETAGSLRGGRRVWMLAQIKDATHDVVANDPVKAYFLVSNSHDGTLAVRVGFTGIRVVCQNTLSMAHHNNKSKLLQVRHTKNVSKGLEKLKEIVDWQRGTFKATVEQFRHLAKLGCTEATLRKYVETVFEPELEARGQDGKDTEARTESVDRLMAKVLPLFQSGRGNNLPGVSGTLWAAYNAVTEYQTWERGRENDTRLDSLWFGQNGKTNERAFEVAMKMAA
jgi:phage/plasmid-like protein (TIGR03299 family)